MTLKEAAECRHTVRKYNDRKIPNEIADKLTERITAGNEKFGLDMKLITENTDALGAAVKLVLSKGVRNYIVLAGKNALNTEEKLGYCGADIMLFAQTLGLNSWWIGGTFSKNGVRKNAPEAEKITGIIAVGYGEVHGAPHKSKRPEDVSKYDGTEPEWFANGVKTALLAPTALNRQAFFIKGNGSKVSLSYKSGVLSDTDMGIVKYHFEIGAGKENFEWI
ncbi:MAG: nitroreductase [Oscillospiraceae bacterium]|nr:nitroreductase [Oscillospiraceae bacterium]